jgi:CheY-like chemotaxis protein
MLAVVIGALNLMQRRLAKGETDVTRYVDAAVDGANRASALTQRLLAFSRQQPLNPSTIDANKLVTSMTELLGRTLGEHIRIETVQGAGLWRTFADQVQLESAIINLAVNGRDAMPDGGRLTIETANTAIDDAYGAEHGISPGQYIAVCVTDTGAGMSPDVMAKAFDPFFTTKEVGKGTGLGLSQVFGFVRQSGGHVKLYSEVGHGTTVKIYLPRYYGAAESAVVSGAELIRDGSSSETVLVVEDDPRVRALSIEALRELGYSVMSAGNGAEALRLIDNGAEIDLIFTDIIMPEMNGRQLAEAAVSRLPKVKVLFTTGYAPNAAVHNGVVDPKTAQLHKPFTLDQLATKVREALDG